MHRLQVPGRAAPALSPRRVTGEPNPEGRAVRSTAGPFLAAAGLWLVDQLTKVWAVEGLADGTVGVIGETLELRLTRNPGGAFSIGTGLTPVLAVVAAVMTVFIFRVARRTDDRIMAYALAGVLGGAVGNLTDRVFRDPGFLRGHVVDFIDLSFWPTFNVADCGITVGVVVVLVRGWSEDTAAGSGVGAPRRGDEPRAERGDQRDGEEP